MAVRSLLVQHSKCTARLRAVRFQNRFRFCTTVCVSGNSTRPDSALKWPANRQVGVVKRTRGSVPRRVGCEPNVGQRLARLVCVCVCTDELLWRVESFVRILTTSSLAVFSFPQLHHKRPASPNTQSTPMLALVGPP